MCDIGVIFLAYLFRLWSVPLKIYHEKLRTAPQDKHFIPTLPPLPLARPRERHGCAAAPKAPPHDVTGGLDQTELSRVPPLRPSAFSPLHICFLVPTSAQNSSG